MVSELEEQRRLNMERNRRALNEFKLKELSNAAFGAEAPKPKPAKRARKSSPRPESEEPPKRTRRLRGQLPPVDPMEFQRQVAEATVKQEQEEVERSRKEGVIELQKVLEGGQWDQALDIFSTFSGKVSQADYFDSIPVTDETVSEMRSQFANLTADPRDVKLTAERIFSIAMHPSETQKMVIVGDKMGELGIWDASKPDLEGVLSFKTHTRAIATIQVDPQNMDRAYTGSYDGSIRRLDFSTVKSTDVFVYDSDPREPVGVSDFCLVDPNNLYYTTLDGHFGTCDMRSSRRKPVIELHDKKIGGFAMNPRQKTQIATASLDRTLKVWDIRNTKSHLYAQYDSRLSVSAASWNTDGQIVCNGYDDTINVFNMDSDKWTPKTVADMELTPDVRIKHNCQTGRWVSILKARWQERPADGVQKFAIANMKRFIDVFAANGQQIAHLNADGLTAVPAVVQFHRSRNWLAGGTASGKVYLFTDPEMEPEIKEEIKEEP